MQLVRYAMETKFRFFRPLLYWLTKEDPELAHDLMVDRARFLYASGLYRFMLGTPENGYRASIPLANAAGFNKDGLIPPAVLKEVGFDKCVIGTVTGKPWAGNPRPRVARYLPGSLTNWMGLPGAGSKKVAENLAAYGTDLPLPITVNIAPTPDTAGFDAIEDLVLSVADLHPYAAEWELNISCPNTAPGDREKHQQSLDQMLWALERATDKRIYVKLSPDMDIAGMRSILDVCAHHKSVGGFTAANTTTRRGDNGIPAEQKGGASGDAVHPVSLRAHQWLSDIIMSAYARTPWTIRACGGISTPGIARQRAAIPRTSEIQLYTALVYQGPRIVRQLRKEFKI